MPNLNATTEQHINQFLDDEAQKEKLAGEIMSLTQELAEKRPDLVDDFVSTVIPSGWTPTKVN